MGLFKEFYLNESKKSLEGYDDNALAWAKVRKLKPVGDGKHFKDKEGKYYVWIPEMPHNKNLNGFKQVPKDN